MKKRFAAVFAAAVFALSPAAAASGPTLTINGAVAGTDAMAQIMNDTTYVSLRSISASLDPASVITWENGTATVQTDNLTLSARESDTYITVNGTKVKVPHGIKNSGGNILVPLRTLAQAFGAVTYWNPVTRQAALVNKFDNSYSSDELYWLSRIISAESRGEPLDGKIAVGNVVLNRVKSPDFPNTIYGRDCFPPLCILAFFAIA